MHRLSLLILAALPLAAQSQAPDTTLQTLLSEVRELRLAIERSTLLGARTQLAVNQLQMDEARAARIDQQLNDVKRQEPGSARLAKGAEHIKDLENMLTSPEFSAPQKHTELEMAIRQQKMDLDQATILEQQRSARESELAIQLQAAQAQVADSRSKIADLAKALDAAIQQLLRRP